MDHFGTPVRPFPLLLGSFELLNALKNLFLNLCRTAYILKCQQTRFAGGLNQNIPVSKQYGKRSGNLVANVLYLSQTGLANLLMEPQRLPVYVLDVRIGQDVDVISPVFILPPKTSNGDQQTDDESAGNPTGYAWIESQGGERHHHQKSYQNKREESRFPGDSEQHEPVLPPGNRVSLYYAQTRQEIFGNAAQEIADSAEMRNVLRKRNIGRIIFAGCRCWGRPPKFLPQLLTHTFTLRSALGRMNARFLLIDQIAYHLGTGDAFEHDVPLASRRLDDKVMKVEPFGEGPRGNHVDVLDFFQGGFVTLLKKK